MIALTNRVSPKLATLYPAVDPARAQRQHEGYCAVLRRNGVDVRLLDVNAEHGDGCFIEDNAIVVDEVAILGTMGAAHRREEPHAIAPVLAEYRLVKCVADD